MTKKCNHQAVDEDCAHCMLQFYKGEFDYHVESLAKIKSIASDLYADRGEDEKTARACNQIMSLTCA